MPCVLTILKKNLKLLSPKEQLIDINNLLHFLNTANFNIRYYETNRKYKLLSQLNKIKKELLNKYK